MSQKKLDTISDGGVVNDLPHYEISLPEDLLAVPDQNPAQLLPRKRRMAGLAGVIDPREVQLEVNRILREEVKSLLTRVGNLEQDLGAARATIAQLEEGMLYVRGCCKVTYCFVKKAEAAHVVPGWTPMKQTYNFAEQK